MIAVQRLKIWCKIKLSFVKFSLFIVIVPVEEEVISKWGGEVEGRKPENWVRCSIRISRSWMACFGGFWSNKVGDQNGYFWKMGAFASLPSLLGSVVVILFTSLLHVLLDQFCVSMRPVDRFFSILLHCSVESVAVLCLRLYGCHPVTDRGLLRSWSKCVVLFLANGLIMGLIYIIAL